MTENITLLVLAASLFSAWGITAVVVCVIDKILDVRDEKRREIRRLESEAFKNRIEEMRRGEA